MIATDTASDKSQQNQSEAPASAPTVLQARWCMWAVGDRAAYRCHVLPKQLAEVGLHESIGAVPVVSYGIAKGDESFC